ncbi:hypothetical protein DFH07DRAFT_952709 [Mycena maculata]|uniref:F-box domain-containing protein n=1 Tax=Mycena maculata TaxID=230809 RepID=A0AAD7JX06_9AGAR|nr:hypothetical protein DFH07DRAFT_952709 [Mycena maculata]
MHIGDLSSEILLEIFGQAKSSAPFTLGGSAVTLPISQVCGTWRSIALNYAALWSDVRLSSQSSLFKLDRLSSRAKGLLISVAIDCTSMPSNTATPLTHCRALLSGLLVHRDRIWALDFIAPVYIFGILSGVMCYKLNKGKYKFPQLRRLRFVDEFELHLAPDQGIASKVPSWRIFFSAPQLRSLSMTAITPTSHESFDHLRELHIEESSYFVHSRTMDDIPGTPLAHFSELQRLSITSSPLPVFQAHATDTQMISFTLSALRPADNAPGTLARFLSTLRMPALQHLTIHGLYGYLWDEFVRWLATDAHYPALRSVTFDSLALAGMDELCLRALASASTMRLIDVDVGAIVRLLESNPCLCPGVHEIVVGDGRLRVSGRS